MSRCTLELPAAKREELVYQRDHERRPYMRERAAALLQIANGCPACRVAKEGLLRPRSKTTVYTWLHDYQQLGYIRPHLPRRRSFSP